MPRSPPCRRRLENAAFLDALRRTGNARLAARELGVHRSTYCKRRARDPAFAADWDSALAAAHAAFALAGGPRPPEAAAPPAPLAPAPALRTNGGERTVVRTRSGRLQLRRAPPGRMTDAAEQAFFAALAASANVRLAAAAAGFAHSSLLARKRRSPAFARRLAKALAQARRALERELRSPNLHLLPAAQEGWPSGLTVLQALRALRMPPLRLHGNVYWPPRRSGSDDGGAES